MTTLLYLLVGLACVAGGAVLIWRHGEVVDPPRPWVEGRLAMWCLDCEAIYQGEGCPGCGGRQGWPLGRWLEKKAPGWCKKEGEDG